MRFTYNSFLCVEIGQARPTLQQSLMERMTFVLSQMLNDISSISGDQGSSSSRTNGNVNPESDEEDVGEGAGAASVSGGVPAARESGGGGGERSLSTSSEQLEDQLGYLRSSFVSRWVDSSFEVLCNWWFVIFN